MEERRRYEKDGFVYLLDDDELTAWIREGSTHGQKIYRMPETVDVEGVDYLITDTEIGAFCNEPDLEELYFHDKFRYVDEDSFRGCYSLRFVSFGKGLKWFHPWTFKDCRQSIKIVIDKDNPDMKVSDDGLMILSSDEKTLIAVIDPYVKELHVPEGICTIGPIAISCLECLEELTLPSSLEKIGGNGVMGCHCLKSLVVPDNVTEIDFQGIGFNDNLETITIPRHLQSLEADLREDNPSLKSIIFSDKGSK